MKQTEPSISTVSLYNRGKNLITGPVYSIASSFFSFFYSTESSSKDNKDLKMARVRAQENLSALVEEYEKQLSLQAKIVLCLEEELKRSKELQSNQNNIDIEIFSDGVLDKKTESAGVQALPITKINDAVKKDDPTPCGSMDSVSSSLPTVKSGTSQEGGFLSARQLHKEMVRLSDLTITTLDESKDNRSKIHELLKLT